MLSLVARVGDAANNTAAARLLNIYGFKCNNVVDVAYGANPSQAPGNRVTGGRSGQDSQNANFHRQMPMPA